MVELEQEISDKSLARLKRYINQSFSFPRRSLKDYWTSNDPKLQEAIRTFAQINTPAPISPLKSHASVV